MRRGLLVAAVALLTLATPSTGPAQPAAITVTVGNHFVTGDDDPYPIRIGPLHIDTVVVPLVVSAGHDVVHLNRDLEGHNMTSVERNGDDRLLFAGQTIGQSELTIVATSHLPPGDYAFICTIHSEFMQGTLSVV